MDGALRDDSSVGIQSVIIVFLAFVALFFPLLPLVRIHQAQHWKEVPCRILVSELEWGHNHKGKRSSTLLFSYEYEVGGRTYKSDRYDFMGFIATEAIKREVVSRYRPGKEAVCYVDPTFPGDAVVNRNGNNLLWFGAIPIGLIAVSTTGLFAQRRARRLSEERRNRLVSSGRGKIILVGMMAIVFTAITTGVGWFAKETLWKSFDALTIFLVVFSLGTLALWAGLVQEILRHGKYGETSFEVKQLPVLLGGMLEGEIVPGKLARLYGSERKFTLTLQSVHQYPVADGSSQRTVEKVLWEATQELESSDGVLKVAFPIPEEANATGDAESGCYLWQFRVTSKRPGVDYLAEFLIPVERGGFVRC